MKVLLTGATGFIGRVVLQRLCLQADIEVYTYGRSAQHSFSCNHISGGLGDVEKQYCALSGAHVVIHCAALAHKVDCFYDFNKINTDATISLARQAAHSGVKRFIFISSIGVHGVCSQDRAFRYDDMVAPWNEYTNSKYAAELGLMQLANETGIEVVIIRPPLVYGANAPGNFGKLIQAVNRGRWLPLGLINNQRSFVALDNLVDLIITCVNHPRAANKTFLVSDDEDISTTQLLEMMTRAAGKSPRLLPVPMILLRLVGKLTGKQTLIERLCGNLRVDIGYTKTTLGWQPPISVEEGIKRCFIEDKEGC